MVREIEYSAPDSVRSIVASMGRTEDLAFSPSNRRFAVAEVVRNRIAVFDIEITSGPNGVRVNLTGAMELSSPALERPHGLDFIDEDTVIVANRAGSVACLELPSNQMNGKCHDIPPAYSGSGAGLQMKDPGSVAVTRRDEHLREILICDSLRHRIIRRVLDWGAGGAVTRTDVLLRRYLDVPDGVAVSPDRQWIAVSNHNAHNVLVYRNSSSLNADSEPDGLLRYISYPHGLAFTPDGRHLIVADAGSPEIHIYGRGPDEWRGVHGPVATLRVMDAATFRRGRHSPMEGGPKGLAVDAESKVVAMTSQFQPLAFLDLETLLTETPSSRTQDDQRMQALRRELHFMEQTARLAAAEQEIRRLRRPRLVQIAALLRRRWRARFRGASD